MNPNDQDDDFSAEAWVRDAFEWFQCEPDENTSQSSIHDPPRLPADSVQIVAIGAELANALGSPISWLETIRNGSHENSSGVYRRLSLFSRSYSAALQQACLDASLDEDVSLIRDTTNVAVDLYLAIHGLRVVEGQGFLLQTLAWPRTEQALSQLVDLMIQFPPADWTASAMALSPLMRNTDWPIKAVFPALLSGLHNPTMIAPLLDLANFCHHQKMVELHPASEHADSLTQMLGGIVARLGMLEEDPTKFGEEPLQIQQVLSDAIAVCVSLCDALGLMGCQDAIGKLHQALSLRHRRVQTEAAGALARLNQEFGRESLVALAAEPVARLRVLHYADELGLSDKIDALHSQPCAIAEAELALWLAQPQQLGLPPQNIEVVDQRMLFWPSFDEPQACFLFRFQYQLPNGEWSNIGMAGPLVHSFAADLADLPVLDIYAAFAGWHAEHPEIFEIPVEHWNAAHQRQTAPLMRWLEDNQHENIRPLWIGCFLNEICLVVESTVDSATGVAVTDGLETIWYSNVGRLRPLGAFEAYSVFKGRKILRTFNPDMSIELETENEPP
ncbi:MAG: HEAT repeat domain-containing protein [Pirellulaceae bacterium]|nr:HEAT repeat domain-containing protein [Pirellulaceae bacterium]